MWRTLNIIVWQKQDLANALRRREYFSQLYAFVYIVAHLIFIFVDVVDEILVMIVIFFFDFKELGFFKDNRFVASWHGFSLNQKPFNSPLIKALLLCYKFQRKVTKNPRQKVKMAGFLRTPNVFWQKASLFVCQMAKKWQKMTK